MIYLINNLKFIGSLILLIAFLLDWNFNKRIASEISSNRERIDDFHYLQLIHQENLNTVLLDNSYVFNHPNGFKILGQFKHDATFYFIMTLPLKKMDKEKHVRELNLEFQKINDNMSYLQFVNFSDRLIGMHKDIFYNDFEDLQSKKKLWDNIFMGVYIMGTVLVIIGEIKK